MFFVRLLDCVGDVFVLGVLGRADALEKARETVVRWVISPVSSSLALATHKGHRLAIGSDVGGVLRSPLVRSSTATVKDTSLRFQQAVSHVLRVLIIRIKSVASCAFKLQLLVHIRNTPNYSQEDQQQVAVLVWAQALLLRDWLDALSAKVLSAMLVIVHHRVRGHAMASATYQSRVI